MTTISPSKNSTILIVGAGVFGLTLALSLHQRGYHNITIFDRYLPPVPDGSSVDISRVIRPDYADPFYARMGLEAMKGWNSTYKSYFHRSGLLCVAQTKGHPYILESRQNVEKMGLMVTEVDGREVRRKCQGMAEGVTGLEGYFNEICGWADARGAIECLARRCSESGIGFVSGARGTVTSLITVENGRKVVGVRTRLGGEVFGDRVILATGAWTPFLVDMSQTSVSTGQPVGFLQLTEEEAETLRDVPIVIDLSTGWFSFPPTPGSNILKIARHGYGYETRRGPSGAKAKAAVTVSAPALDANNASTSFIPDDAEQALRNGLKLLFPQFQDRKFLRMRLCWYTDTANGDFVVDHHPEYENLFLACGGSGQ